MVAVQRLERHVPNPGCDVSSDVDLVVAPSGRTDIDLDAAPSSCQPLDQVFTHCHPCGLHEPAFGVGLLHLAHRCDGFLLWHGELGESPRYGTARCAASMRDLLSNADWKARVAEALPPERIPVHRQAQRLNS